MNFRSVSPRLLPSALALASLLALAACAQQQGLVAKGNDTYVITKRGSAGISTADLRQQSVTEADQLCTREGKIMHVLGAQESDTSRLFGQHPIVQTRFKCGM